MRATKRMTALIFMDPSLIPFLMDLKSNYKIKISLDSADNV